MSLVELAGDLLSEKKWGPDQKLAFIAAKYSVPLTMAVSRTRTFIRSLERLELAAEEMRNELAKPPRRRVLKAKAERFTSAVNAVYAPFKEAREAMYELADISGIRTKRYSRKGKKGTPPERMSHEDLSSAVEGMIRRLNPAIRDAAEDGSFFLRKADELLGRMSDRRKVMRLTTDKVDDEVGALVDVFLDFRDKTSKTFWGLAGGIAKRIPVLNMKFRQEYLGEETVLERDAVLDMEKDPELWLEVDVDDVDEGVKKKRARIVRAPERAKRKKYLKKRKAKDKRQRKMRDRKPAVKRQKKRLKTLTKGRKAGGARAYFSLESICESADLLIEQNFKQYFAVMKKRVLEALDVGDSDEAAYLVVLLADRAYDWSRDQSGGRADPKIAALATKIDLGSITPRRALNQLEKLL